MKKLAVFLSTLLLGTTSLWASEAAASEINSGDTAWMLTSTCLVLMMTLPGLALFYGGLVRSKNILSIFVQCFAMAGLMSILWVVFGYAVANGGEGDWIAWNPEYFMLNHLTPDLASGSIPESVFVTFQMTFIIITPALIVGAFAERMKFSAMLIFTTVWTILSYLPIWHMAWGGGFFHGTLKAIDFAGGNVVHINAGIAGLLACIMLGKRRGYPGPGLVPHNVPLVLIGAGLLWVGWFGFNAGSACAANGSAGMAMLTTQISCAAGVVVWMLMEWMIAKKPTAVGVATGAVAGLVAITPAAGSTTIGGALALGAISSFICYFTATKLKHKLGYDDTLDVFGVHGVGGIVGAILTGVFLREGATELSVGEQVWAQFLSVVITIAWSAVAATIGLFLAKLLAGGLRVDTETEDMGLDLSVHGEEAYNSES